MHFSWLFLLLQAQLEFTTASEELFDGSSLEVCPDPCHQHHLRQILPQVTSTALCDALLISSFLLVLVALSRQLAFLLLLSFSLLQVSLLLLSSFVLISI